MERQRLTAKELKQRYRNGERNFANVDLSGESLRGMNLKGIDLSGADLSRTDIRGTRFVNATLRETIFSQAKAGLQRRWLIGQLALALPLTALFNIVAALFSAIFITYFFDPAIIADITIIPGISRPGLKESRMSQFVNSIKTVVRQGYWHHLHSVT